MVFRIPFKRNELKEDSLNFYLRRGGILLDPLIRNKWHFLEILTRLYCKQQPDFVSDHIFETILNREMKVSTGLGGGVAIPHARTDRVHDTGVLFVRFKDGIEWDSMDGSLVHFLFLVIGPSSSTEEYLQVLSKISKMMKRRDNRSGLLKAKTNQDIHKIISGVVNRKRLR